MRLLSLLLFFLPCTVFSKSFLESHEKGWFWYERPAFKNKKKTDDTVKSSSNNISATQMMHLLQNNVTESLNRAILQPTEKNLLHYANTYYKVINQGQYFADAYKMLLLKHPQYDYYLRFPVNHNARAIFDRSQHQANENAVKALASTHGFLFFFSSNCQYCHVFAPTVKRFAERYGIHVMAITIDGGTLPEFPYAVPDNGIAKKMGVQTWPALFVVNPKVNQVIPLANGVVSVSELEEIVFKYAQLQHKNINAIAFK